MTRYNNECTNLLLLLHTIVAAFDRTKYSERSRTSLEESFFEGAVTQHKGNMILKFCKRETELRLEIWTLEERRELVASLLTWGEQSFLVERIL